MGPLNANPVLRGIYRRVPRLRPLMRDMYGLITGRPPPYFTGWLMSTDHEHAWIGDDRFGAMLRELARFDFTTGSAEDLDAWRWRLWIVVYAARHALAHTNVPNPTFVECGVADGLTAYAALCEGPSRMHLYDAWTRLPNDQLRVSERAWTQDFTRLSIDRTRRNLARFLDRIEWQPGYIPRTLTEPPAGLVYVSIDLNSADATAAVLEHFWPALQPGGVIVFDDYGWRPFWETKRTIDESLTGHPGTLLALPTGQALYFR